MVEPRLGYGQAEERGAMVAVVVPDEFVVAFNGSSSGRMTSGTTRCELCTTA
jgi:hypothetical protein